MTMDPDPWNWEFGEVQRFFQQDAVAYIADFPNGQLPTPLSALAQKFADSEVNGASLLDYLNDEMLRVELGVKPMRFRQSIMHIIQRLRKRSRTYLSIHASLRPQTPASIVTPQLRPAIGGYELPNNVVPTTETAHQAVGENVRSGELQVKDRHGCKRRRLELAPPETQQDLVTKPARDATAYLPDSAMPVDEVFYGPTALGNEFRDLHPSGSVAVDHADPETEEDNFSFTAQGKRPGETSFVNSRMQHFLFNPETVVLRRRDRDAIAVLPYPERLLRNKARSATVIHSGNGDEYIATREQVSLLQSGADFTGMEQAGSAGEFDYLLQKYKHTADDKELPTYGESETSSEMTDTEDEDEVDAEEAAEEVEEMLQKSRIAEIVDEHVKVYSSEWRESKLPALEKKKAWSVWRKHKNSRTLRDSLIEGAQARTKHFTRRIKALKQEFVDHEYFSETSIRKMMSIMEPAIEDLLVERWNIDVWRRRKEPAHTVLTVQHKRTSSHHALHTPATGNAAPAFTTHPDDKMSVSPTPVTRTNEPVTADEGEEEFHTPTGSLAVSPTVDAEGFEAADEMSLDEEHVEPQSRADDDGTFIAGSPPQRRTSSGSSVRATPRHGSAKAPSLRVLSPAENLSDSEDSPLLSELNLPPATQVKRQPETPVAPKHGSSMTEPIEIGSSDSPMPSSSRRGAPQPSSSLKRSGKAKARTTKKPVVMAEIEVATAADVDSWELDDLVNEGDRRRLLVKLLREAGSEKLLALGLAFTELAATGFQKQLRFAIEANLPPFEDKLNGKYKSAMLLCAYLAVAWFALEPKYFMDRPQPKLPWAEMLKDTQQIRMFVQMLTGILKFRDSKLFQTPKASKSSKTRQTPKTDKEVHVITDSDEVAAESTPKKRKRKVEASASAMQSQTAALARAAKYKRAMESQNDGNSSQIAALEPINPSKSDISINPARDDELYDPIYIHSTIAKQMKPHQIDGVRFLWREMTAKGDEGEDIGQGCLLAHTMGLGKTMQTIALLVAVREASESKKHRVRDQLPEHLRLTEVRGNRQLRMMILCPPSLLENWQRELDQWVKKKFRVTVVDASGKSTQMRKLEDWYRVGGILLIGYAMFRILTIGRSKKQEADNADDEMGARLDDILLKGPEIVVADEAHQLKNMTSDISKAASNFATESRVALTGTPLSNNVDEIYALINWVAVGYLGQVDEFRARYANPIAEGLYGDSTPADIRRSMKRLRVLHTQIEPKVNRADISALKGSLKPKVEFVVFVPLTPVQQTLYQRYVHSLIGDGQNKEANQVRLFAWLGVLQLLTNHPVAFRKKLLTPKPKKSQAGRDETPGASDAGSNATSAVEDVAAEQLTEAGADHVPGDEDIFALGFTQEMVNNILQHVEFDEQQNYSAKMSLLLGIIGLSMDCGDKVLVFSGSIPTIQYVDKLLRSQSIRFGRIDGTTKITMRMQTIEDFHNDKFEVMIVSTRAGGVGLNIQGANRVVLLDFGFNPTWEEQAVGRAYRIGQTKPVFVYRFVAGGTFETSIYNKQLFKSSLAQRVVDKKNPRRHALRNTSEYLYQPLPVKQEDVNQWAGKDQNVLDKLLARHRPDAGQDLWMRSIQTMETLQEEALDAPLNEEEQKEVLEEIQQEGVARQRSKKSNGGLAGLSNTAVNGLPRGAFQARSMVPPASTQFAQSTVPGFQRLHPAHIQPNHAHPANSMRPMSSTAPNGARQPPQGGLPNVYFT